jgi:uncharacterized protein YgiM (DUF1202 family)
MSFKLVLKPYKAAYLTPIVVKAGDAITIQEKETEWPGWYWFKTTGGLEGWIPQTYVQIQNNLAKVSADYTTKEFTVNKGELYELIKAEAGWSFCKSNTQEEGWIPDECLTDFE